MADIATRVRRVELRCSSVEASSELYCRLVGLEPVELSADAAALRPLEGGEPLLALRRAERPGKPPRRATGLFHTAFRYPTRAGLADALRRLEGDLGWVLTGASDHGVSEALYLDDPDGLGIELYRDRPRDQWPSPQGGERVHMFTAPLDLRDLASAATGAGLATATAGVDIGHVHLKVADAAVATAFWQETMGAELMTTYGPQAAFLGWDGYHHHIGANTWLSAGADPEPADGPGLESVAIAAGPGGAVETPDGVTIDSEAGR